MLLPEAGGERFVVEIPHTEEGGDWEEGVREHGPLGLAPVLCVGGVEVEEGGVVGGGWDSTA